MPELFNKNFIKTSAYIFAFGFLLYTVPVYGIDINSIYFEDLTEIKVSVPPSQTTEISYNDNSTEDIQEIISKDPIINSIYLDDATVKKGYTTRSDDNRFSLGFKSEVLTEGTDIIIKRFNNRIFQFPENLDAVSDVYEFDISKPDSLDKTKPFILQIEAIKDALNAKRIYFYNKPTNEWRQLPSWTQDEKLVRAYIHLPYAKLVVLQEKDVKEIGDASWYAYKDCLCAASPDFPKGSKVKVDDLDTGKSVIVTINDWGPDRSIFPERVIDLDKRAFQKLGKLSWGVLHRIKVTPL